MTDIMILVLILVVLMIALLVLGLYFYRHPIDTGMDESEYIDSEGNHKYYDRSIIEKKEFLRRNPSEKDKVRTFSRMFKGKD